MLDDADIDLSWIFRFSLINDLIQGMWIVKSIHDMILVLTLYRDGFLVQLKVSVPRMSDFTFMHDYREMGIEDYRLWTCTHSYIHAGSIDTFIFTQELFATTRFIQYCSA